jgi:hypothetical protein
MGAPGFTLYFGDSLMVSSHFDLNTGQIIFTGNKTYYDKNQWNDISIIFNPETKKITAKINSKVVYDAINKNQEGFGFVGFEGVDYTLNTPEPPALSMILLDNILYRKLPATATISPNPANEILRITPDVDMTADWQVRLLNSMGQVVATQKSTGSSPIEIETHDMKVGMYIVDFQSDATRWTKKVVVAH